MMYGVRPGNAYPITTTITAVASLPPLSSHDMPPILQGTEAILAGGCTGRGSGVARCSMQMPMRRGL